MKTGVTRTKYSLQLQLEKMARKMDVEYFFSILIHSFLKVLFSHRLCGCNRLHFDRLFFHFFSGLNPAPPTQKLFLYGWYPRRRHRRTE